MTPEELAALMDSPAPSKPGDEQRPVEQTTRPTAPKAPGGMTPAELDALMDGPTPAPAQTQGTPAPSPSDQPAQYDPSKPIDSAARYDATGQIGGAIVTGAAKSIYQTSDFLFGKPEEADKTETRRSVEALDKSLGESSIANSFVSGLSQFAVGMLGAGKVVSAAKLLPVAGAAIEGAEATRRGAMLLSSGKAAAVGAVALIPTAPGGSTSWPFKAPRGSRTPSPPTSPTQGTRTTRRPLGA